jgi:tetratricopeptide (TPR) repeat protein
LDWLRGGITDMLVTNLSRSKSLSVLSRQQLHLLLERAGRADAQKLRLDEAQGIARRAQAEALVMGSFAHLGEKTRIDVALHDARSGQLMAAESLVADKPEQILTQVDLLSYKLATSLGAGASDAEHEPRLADVMTSDLDAYRYYSVAMEQAQMFQLHEAIALLKKALARDPRFAMAEARIGYIYAVRMFQGKQAWPHLQKAMRLADRLQEKDMLFIRAWSAQARNESAQAVEAYKAIIAQYPLEAEAYQRLGWLLNSQGRVEEALQVLRQGLVTDPEGKDLYNSLGSVYQRLGRFDEARVAYQRYIQLAPNDPNAWDSLAALHQFLGQYDQAFEGYNRALSINPESKVVVIHLGNLYFRQGRYSAALAQYQRFIQLAQDDDQRARGYGYQAWVYFKMGDRERAEAATAKQLGLLKSPTWDLAPLFLKRGAYARMGTLDATQFTKEAFERLNSGGYQRFWFIHRGWVALSQGQAETAVEQFREALRQKNLDWNIDSYEDCLAYAFLNLGRWDEAIAEYERLLRVNPRYPLAQYHLARAYEGKGDRERALASYRNFLQIWKDADPGLPEVTEAKKRLNG